MLIHRDALIVHEVTTPEDSRYFLNGALIDKQGRSVATDGHQLVRFTPHKESLRDATGKETKRSAKDFIVSRDALRTALSTLNTRQKANGDQCLHVVPNGKTITISTVKGDQCVTIESPTIVAEFPAYERVLVLKQPIKCRVILNPAYLETLGRMAKQIGARSVELALYGSGEYVEDQLLFEARGDNGTLDGAIMPMRKG